MKGHIDFNEKKRLKIAFFTHWYFPEKIGCSTRVDNYCKTFSKYYDVDIICPIPAFPFGKPFFFSASKLPPETYRWMLRDGGAMSEATLMLEPKAWWFECCLPRVFHA